MRVDWADLPSGARRAVEDRVGPVLAVEPVPDGLTCATAAVLTTATGRVFVKGVPDSDTGGVAAQAVEAAVNPVVREVGPRLIASVCEAGWDLLVFEYADGRHADLAQAEDRHLVAETLSLAQHLRAPAGLLQFADRYAAHLDPRQLALLHGGALLHTDTNPHNLIVEPGRAHLVDWAMAATGPAWVDVALTAVRLMEADCPPAQALGWAAQFPSWREAAPGAVQALVTGSCRAWEARVDPTAARSSNGRYTALLGVEHVVA